jgi:predicted CopG family antitoxin
MGKVNKSITIDKDVAKLAQEQAKIERRSFSSFVEFLIHYYLKNIAHKN